MSATPNAPGLAANRSSMSIRILKGLFLSVFINPFALVVAVVAIFLLTHLVGGLFESDAAHDLRTLHLITCGACITALALVAVMAASHFLVTVLLGVCRSISVNQASGRVNGDVE